ncbi:hypothetical protein BDN71DRAFT_1434152 [Pleurotus eryngii]|uniref:Secreted protein n=1 Tax=Pleurotus eryngii TaxID=5323 RepID=A0A9P5ZPI6_PLEER|nr:hypothetical protein BDN71DRAFT_1434152 [Pleurotus eryngii]
MLKHRRCVLGLGLLHVSAWVHRHIMQDLHTWPFWSDVSGLEVLGLPGEECPYDVQLPEQHLRRKHLPTRLQSWHGCVFDVQAGLQAGCQRPHQVHGSPNIDVLQHHLPLRQLHEWGHMLCLLTVVSIMYRQDVKQLHHLHIQHVRVQRQLRACGDLQWIEVDWFVFALFSVPHQVLCLLDPRL